MKKILVAYATMSGSTAEVAQTVAKEIAEKGMQVEVLPLDQANELGRYDAIVLGAPMVMGWHRSALKFLTKNREALRQIPLAAFATGMSLTSAGETEVSGVPVFVDETRGKRRPAKSQRAIHGYQPLCRADAQSCRPGSPGLGCILWRPA
jgi:menaquinone-dependent protoporphyrinogen IX oxidase